MLTTIIAIIMVIIPVKMAKGQNNVKTTDKPIKIAQGIKIPSYILAETPTQKKEVIKPGESLAEIQQKAEEEKQKQIALENARKKYTESYTGHGNAIPLYIDYTNNCVEWVKQQTGINHPLGKGGRGHVQGQEPKVGAVGVEAGGYPHAVLIAAVNGTKITIRESNYTANWITERTLDASDFLGYIYN